MKGEVRTELDRLNAKHGELTAQIVVDEAIENEQSPLRHVFEWDDELAGEAYRLGQAHRLIQEYRVTILIERHGDPTPHRIRIRKFHSVTTDDNRNVFVSLDVLQENPLYRAQVMTAMERDWKALQTKYGIYAEFWQLVEATQKEKGNGSKGKASTSKRTRTNKVAARRRNDTKAVRGART